MTSGEMLNERVARLEVQIGHLSKQLDEQNEILKRLDAAFEQAKGAKWMLLGIASAAGFIAGKSATLMSWFSFAKGG